MVDRSGQQLGNYRITRLLGKGGFAEVYLAEHTYLKVPVAIKVLHTQLERDDLEGFLKEAQTIARLIHPHIVRVTDFGVDGETPYLVMDYAPNGTLRQRHPRRTQLPSTTVVSYVKQVADALQHAHDERLIHRDIKPENMLLGRNNDILLSDFGIATVAHRTSTQNTQMVAGTATYMAPELFKGKPYSSSDQYSLAIVVYEWLCGEPPFTAGDFIQLGYQHTFVPPEPLREKVPAIPSDVEQVMTTALAKDPKQRFMNVQAFANALEQASQPGKTPYVVKPQPAPQSISSTTPAHPASYAPVQPALYTPPAQYAPVMQQTSLASSDSYPGGYAGEPKIETKPPEQQRIHPWNIGKRQVMATLIGLAICIGLSSFIPFLFPTYSSPPTINVVIICVLAALALVMPQFFGATFGPWSGLFVGGFGSLTGIIVAANIYSLRSNGTFMSSYQDASYFSNGAWSIYLGFALAGLISGFAMFKIKGRYNMRRTFGYSSLGAGIGTTFVIFSAILNYPYEAASVLGQSIIAVLVYIALGLILLPILLIAYNKIIGRGQQA